MFYMKPQYRDAKPVNQLRVDLAIIFYIRKGFAASGHSHPGTVKIAIVFFEGGAESTCFFLFSIYRVFSVHFFHPPTETIQWHSHTTSVFDMISPGEVQFFII